MFTSDLKHMQETGKSFAQSAGKVRVKQVITLINQLSGPIQLEY